jgi:hypothetical protein
LEAHRKEPTEKVRSPLAPGVICEVARKSGWRLGMERVVIPGERMLDGAWEVGSVRAEGFVGDVGSELGNGWLREVVVGLGSAMMAALGR